MENPIKTVVLGGDNVYPQKMRIGKATDFTKVYSQKTLMNGVHMLHGKDIYTALGNHNVGGPMLNTQLGLKEWTIPNRYYSINFSIYCIFLFAIQYISPYCNTIYRSSYIPDSYILRISLYSIGTKYHSYSVNTNGSSSSLKPIICDSFISSL
jgi:hypothetical protein